MCLLSCKPTEVQWNIEHLKQGIKQNRDGWGLMGIKEGKLWWSKGFTEAELEEALPFYQDLEALFHARWATHGTKTRDQIHPYGVVDDIYMAHNGVFDIKITDETKSDTWHMAQELALMGRKSLVYRLTKSRFWLDTYGKQIGTNKVAFISPAFGTVIVNKHLGHDVDGVWMSNSSYKSYYWDKGGKSVESTTTLHDHFLVEDMLESWMYGADYLVAADVTTDPKNAIRAIKLLLKKYRELEDAELLASLEDDSFGASFEPLPKGKRCFQKT